MTGLQGLAHHVGIARAVKGVVGAAVPGPGDGGGGRVRRSQGHRRIAVRAYAGLAQPLDEIIAGAPEPHGVDDQEIQLGLADHLLRFLDRVATVQLARAEAVHDLDEDGHAKGCLLEQECRHLLRLNRARVSDENPTAAATPKGPFKPVRRSYGPSKGEKEVLHAPFGVSLM